MLLPQRPYIPIGPLREALAYPAASRSSPTTSCATRWSRSGLPGFAERLDDSDNWQMRLSGGEQQRLAVARALLAEPDWLFLDESTASLDEKSEADLYRAIAETLPQHDARLDRPPLDARRLPQAPDHLRAARERPRHGRRRRAGGITPRADEPLGLLTASGRAASFRAGL